MINLCFYRDIYGFIIYVAYFLRTKDLKVDACLSNLYFMLKLFLYKFYDFFCRRHSLMNRPCCNNLLQFMQHNKFRSLKLVWAIFYQISIFLPK